MEWLLAIVMGLGLFGTLQNKTKIETVVDYKTIMVIPPDKLIGDCLIPDIPTEDVYLNTLTWTGKEDLLFIALQDAHKKSILCNTQLSSLRSWKVDQVKIHTEPKVSDTKQ